MTSNGVGVELRISLQAVEWSCLSDNTEWLCNFDVILWEEKCWQQCCNLLSMPRDVKDILTRPTCQHNAVLTFLSTDITKEVII